MRLVKARTKALHEFPSVEVCCEEMKILAVRQTSMLLDIDLDDQAPFKRFAQVGHCGQDLPYSNSVMTYINGQQHGYIPFELIHIQEGL